jgi:predicted hotdog family 3-hydroxylacyl-ACP dehydratase
MIPTDYSGILEKLPHRGPMRLVDEILSLDGTSVVTNTRMDDKRLKFLGSDLPVGTYWGIELIAQSGALPLIATIGNGKAHAGVIVQVKSFRSFVLEIEEPAILTTRCSAELQLEGTIASIRGSVFAEDVLLCEASLMLAMQET